MLLKIIEKIENIWLQRPISPWPDVCSEVMEKVVRFDQRDIPACVAHATALLMQIEWYRRTGKIIRFSPRFLDILSWTEGLPLEAGRDPDVVMELALRVGCCTDDFLPNDTTLSVEKYRDRSMITEEMKKQANKYRLERLGLEFYTLFKE